MLRVEGEALQERNEETNRIGGGKRARRGFQTRERGKEKRRKKKGAFPSPRLPDGSKLFTRL